MTKTSLDKVYRRMVISEQVKVIFSAKKGSDKKVKGGGV